MALFIIFMTVSDPWVEAMKEKSHDSVIAIDLNRASLSISHKINLSDEDQTTAACSEEDCEECHRCHLGHCAIMLPTNLAFSSLSFSREPVAYVWEIPTIYLQGIDRPPKYFI